MVCDVDHNREEGELPNELGFIKFTGKQQGHTRSVLLLKAASYLGISIVSHWFCWGNRH